MISASVSSWSASAHPTGALPSRHLKWPGEVLADQDRVLYHRLGIGRARLRRLYFLKTMAAYAIALALGERLAKPVEDARQLGADAVVVDGVARMLWRPRTPNDRSEADDVIATATAALGS